MGDRGIQPFANSGIPAAKALAFRSVENHELLGRPYGVDVERLWDSTGCLNGIPDAKRRWECVS